MSKKLRHGTALIHQSLHLLKQHKILYFPPLLASLLSIALLSLILKPIIHHEQALSAITHPTVSHVLWLYAFVLIFLFLMHQIALYCCSVLIRCIFDCFWNKEPSLSAGFKAANSLFFRLYLWNLFMSTIGIFLNLFQAALYELRLYQKFSRGLNWFSLTFLALPIMMIEKTGPIKTIKRNADLLISTWGEHLKPNFGFLPLFLFFRIMAFLPLILTVYFGSGADIILGAIASISLLLIISMINSAARCVLSVALYHFATKGDIPKGFSESLILNAFQNVDI